MGDPDPAMSSWTVTGEVATYSGFGLWLDSRLSDGAYCGTCCTDAAASGCEGIAFTISGTGLTETQMMDFRLETWDNYIVDATGKGGCVPMSEATQYSDCVNMAYKFALPATPMEIQVPFAMK